MYYLRTEFYIILSSYNFCTKSYCIAAKVYPCFSKLSYILTHLRVPHQRNARLLYLESFIYGASIMVLSLPITTDNLDFNGNFLKMIASFISFLLLLIHKAANKPSLTRPCNHSQL